MSVLMVLVVLGCGLVAGPPAGADVKPIPARWQPVEPPHSGLKCWRTLSIGHGALYCEADPTATHGAAK